MQVLSLLEAVLPRHSLSHLATHRLLQGARRLIQRLLEAVLRSVRTRVVSRARRTPTGALHSALQGGSPIPRAKWGEQRPLIQVLQGSVTTMPPPSVPRSRDVGGLIHRLQQTWDGQPSLEQTLADLEQVIAILRGGPLDLSGLERCHQQIRQLTEPDADPTGFELNMAWALLERKLRAVAQGAGRG